MARAGAEARRERLRAQLERVREVSRGLSGTRPDHVRSSVWKTTMARLVRVTVVATTP